MDKIKTVESITPELFRDLLIEKWRQDREGKESAIAPSEILSISTERVEQGVLSQVYRLHLKFEEQLFASSADVVVPPEKWIVKIRRTDLDLSWMFRNESNFYQQFVPFLVVGNNDNDHSGRSPLPFRIPPFLSGDENHLVLEEIQEADTMALTDGCPPDKIPVLLNCLAALHAKCWKNPLVEQKATECLVFPAGMGQRLHPLQMEGLFLSSWRDTVDHVQFDSKRDEDTKRFINYFCQELERRQLRKIRNLVHQHRVTLIHGDFHIANFLFPNPRTEKSSGKPVLIDWATSGWSNPMIDLVFFLVVSTNDQAVSESQRYLSEYHDALISFNPSLANEVCLATLNEWFIDALVCQWIILVAYDKVCRQIASSERDEERRHYQLQHFRNVNRRAILALRSTGNYEEMIFSRLEITTEGDMKEAAAYCAKVTLAI